jgi:hypothetical protein
LKLLNSFSSGHPQTTGMRNHLMACWHSNEPALLAAAFRVPPGDGSSALFGNAPSIDRMLGMACRNDTWLLRLVLLLV